LARNEDMATPHSFSEVDKKILKLLLEPIGKVSSRVLEQELGVPRSTIQRRRDYLEKNYLTLTYSLNLDSLGFRRVDLLIYTGGGATLPIARELLKRDEVVSVGRSIGEHTIDLRAEVIIKDNSELLGLLELVKAMPNVKDVIWSEIVEVVGSKKSIPSGIIDRM
jgi:DNA-binding Lrp family transcriptional regulator